jgi:hypothetical protein
MSFILSAFGDAYAGEAQANAYQANADQQVLQGMQQRNIAITKAQEQGTASLRQQGAIRAAYGASGVVPTGGSALEVMSDQVAHGELARQRQLWQGVAEQQSSDQQAASYRAQGKAARTAGYISAIGKLVSGAEKSAMAAGAA